MNTKLLFYLNLILLSACNQPEIKIKQTDKCFEQFPKDRDFKDNIASYRWSQAKESYMISTGDSWTYSSTVIFEKYNDLDYRLKTINFNRDSFSTERKLTKQDWEYICSSFDSLGFWCTNAELDRMSIDGHETTITGKIDSHYHIIRLDAYDKTLKDIHWNAYKKNLLKTSLNLLRFGGFQGLKKPRFMLNTIKTDSIRIESYFTDPFIESSEMFLNQIKADSKEGVFLIKIPKSALGKVHLIAKAVFFNGEKFTYEVDIDEYFLNKIREKRFYE